MNQSNSLILKTIDILVEKRLSKHTDDKTFPSVVYGINDDGTYTIIKEKQKYKVKCAINTTLSLGTHVWVKIPCGRLHDMHICGLR